MEDERTSASDAERVNAMDAPQREHLQERLEHEKARLERRLRQEEADLAAHRLRVSERDPCAILTPGTAKEDAEQEVRYRRAEETHREIRALEQALQRLRTRDRALGVCVLCRRVIEAERLDVLPATTVCQRCATADG